MRGALVGLVLLAGCAVTQPGVVNTMTRPDCDELTVAISVDLIALSAAMVWHATLPTRYPENAREELRNALVVGAETLAGMSAGIGLGNLRRCE